MKKLFAGLAVLIVVLAVMYSMHSKEETVQPTAELPATAVQPVDTSSWQKYTSSAKGITFRYPSKYVLRESTGKLILEAANHARIVLEFGHDTMQAAGGRLIGPALFSITFIPTGGFTNNSFKTGGLKAAYTTGEPESSLKTYLFFKGSIGELWDQEELPKLDFVRAQVFDVVTPADYEAMRQTGTDSLSYLTEADRILTTLEFIK